MTKIYASILGCKPETRWGNTHSFPKEKEKLDSKKYSLEKNHFCIFLASGLVLDGNLPGTQWTGWWTLLSWVVRMVICRVNVHPGMRKNWKIQKLKFLDQRKNRIKEIVIFQGHKWQFGVGTQVQMVEGGFGRPEWFTLDLSTYTWYFTKKELSYFINFVSLKHILMGFEWSSRTKIQQWQDRGAKYGIFSL